MKVVHVASGKKLEVLIERVNDEDMKKLSVKRYFFNWTKEADDAPLYKLHLVGDDDIKGVMSIVDHENEKRIEIRLLAASRENVVLKKEKEKKKKEYDDIAGNLIAFACRLAVFKYAEDACVSLRPKSDIKNHYMVEYGMKDAGLQVYLELSSLQTVINTFIL